jgi:hypothetical protein
MPQKQKRLRAIAGLALIFASLSAAFAGSIEALLSVVFFENEFAYQDAETFVCRNIALTADGDYCHASFKVLDPALCKVEIVREMRATWGEEKGREFILAKEVFTLANIDPDRTVQEIVPDKKAARSRLEGLVEVYRHEGYNYSFDLDPSGNYASCRVDGASLPISEQDCVARGTQALKPSNTVALLYAEHNFQMGMDALHLLLTTYCPRYKIRS